MRLGERDRPPVLRSFSEGGGRRVRRPAERSSSTGEHAQKSGRAVPALFPPSATFHPNLAFSLLDFAFCIQVLLHFAFIQVLATCRVIPLAYRQ
jgi:hypothetical protein